MTAHHPVENDLDSDPTASPSSNFGGGARTPSGLLTFARSWSVESIVLVVALVARLGVILRRDGIRGIIGYDCGVYFAGADALIHGRLPYRDFTMVHPPGVTLVLTPFAALTSWITDWHAFVVATVAFCVLGAVNAVLVVRVCRRLGFGALASGVGGLFYAAWFGSVSGEFEVKLEPLGNLFLLCGLLLLLRAQRMRAQQMSAGRFALANVVAGVVLGLTLTVKIWWGVPVVLLVLWHAWRQRGVGGQHGVRAGVQTVAGAVISVVVVYAPFFLADPSGMFSSVVTDQLGRPRGVGTTHRIGSLTTLRNLKDHLSYSTQAAAAVLFVLAIVAVLVLAWRASVGVRGLVVLVIVQFVIVFAAPSYYQYYGDYVAVGLAVCIGAAACSAAGLRVPRLRIAPSLLITATVFVITSLVTITGSMAVRPFAGAAQLTRAVSSVKCVTAINTTVLIRLDALTRGLEAGCPNWIDVTGHRYSLPSPDSPNGIRTWHREVTRYLLSGDAVIVSNSHVPKSTAKAIKKRGVLTRAGGHTIYRGKQ